MNKRVGTVALAVGLLGAHYGLCRTAVDYGPKWTSPTAEYETPHVAWMKPDARGPVRVLFITYRESMREVVELQQRMDLAATVFAMDTPALWYDTNEGMYWPGHPTQEEMEQDLLGKLAGTYDLVVLGHINWSALPMTARYQILKKVKEGTPLLGLPHDADEYLTRATQQKVAPEIGPLLVPWKGLPAFSRYADYDALLAGTVEASRFGQGRIFLLKGYRPGALQMLTPGVAGDPFRVRRVEYDYYLAYVTHLLLAAAGRKPDITLGGSDCIVRDRAETAPLEFVVNAGVRRAVECRMVLRSADNEVLRDRVATCTLVPGANRVAFDIGRPAAGEYFADLWVTERGKCVTFGSAYVTVRSPAEITQVAVNPVWRQAAPVSGTVTVANPPGQWTGMYLKVVRHDSYGRVTGRSRIALDRTGGASAVVPFTLPASAPALSIIQSLDAELWDGRGLVHRSTAVCSVCDLAWPEDLRYLIWASWNQGARANFALGYPVYALFENLARAGFDIQYTDFSAAPLLANLRHMDIVPSPLSYGSASEEQPHVRIPCPNDPGKMREQEDILRKTVERQQPYSTAEYSLGDETFFAHSNEEWCFCPYCQTAFRAFLKQEYGSLEAVNREYQMTAASWEAITPVTLADVQKDARLAPLWVDYRRHMENTWSGLFRRCSEVARSVAPGARIGYEGSDTEVQSCRAADFYRLMQAMQINGTYDGAFVPPAVMDFSRPGTLLGLGWYGGYHEGRCAEEMRRVVWRQLFRGANSFWVWHAAPGTYGGSIMAPDLSFFDFFQANIREVGEIKRGVGKLLMTARRDDDRTAVLYSASSVHVSALTNGLPGSEAVLNALITMLEDGGNQFRIVAYRQVEEGALRSGGYRYLILPYAQALSPREAAEIESFVRDGGTVIADLRPGVCDEHGKPLPQGSLDRVFGVTQATAAPQPKRGTVKLTAPGFPAVLPAAASDASLRLTTASAGGEVEGTPALIVNTFGKGRAILLNFSLATYAGGDSGPFWRSLCASVGMPERVRLPAGAPAGLRLYRFAAGDSEYLGVLQELPELPMQYTLKQAKPLPTVPVRMTLDRRAHVYDVRTEQYRGFTDTIVDPVTPGIARLYALLPYRVQGLAVRAPARVSAGSELAYQVEIRASGGKIGRHVLRRELVAPDGTEVSWYAENATADGGALTGRLTLAWNEQPGTWKIRFKDIATGTTAERSFRVEAAHE